MISLAKTSPSLLSGQNISSHYAWPGYDNVKTGLHFTNKAYTQLSYSDSCLYFSKVSVPKVSTKTLAQIYLDQKMKEYAVPLFLKAKMRKLRQFCHFPMALI